MRTRDRAIVWGAATALAVAWLASRRASSYSRLHPELRSPLLRLRALPFTALGARLLRALPVSFPLPTDVHVEAHRISGVPDVPVYVYRPQTLKSPAALLYIHGGGFIIGSASMFHATCARYAKELGIVVVNVDYRLSPDTPFPAPWRTVTPP